MKRMKKVVTSFMIVTIVGLGVLWAEEVNGAETLTVTKDHFEFRDAPRVAEETLLGTLRKGTPVEWTGTTSGSWFEVRAPNGQTGWIHKSGVSTPRTAPTRSTSPQTSRSVPRPTQSTLEKKVAQLEKANKQYKSLLEEKDQRIAALSADVEDLEQKLVETSQQLEDAKQLQQLENLNTPETQTEIAELQETLKQKDEALLADKVELTRLRNQVKTLEQQAGTVAPLERLILYGLNGLWLIALVIVGFLYFRQRKSSAPPDYTQEFHETPASERAEMRATSPSEEPAMVTVSDTPQAGSGVEPPESTESDEDVVIELGDVLPVTVLDEEGGHVEEPVEEIEDIEEIADIDVVAEEVEEDVIIPPGEELIDVDEVVEVVEDVNEGEEVEEIEALEELTDVEEVEDVEKAEEYEETAVETFEELADEREEEGSEFDFEAIYEDEEGVESSRSAGAVEVAGEAFEILDDQDTQLVEVSEDTEAAEPESFDEVEAVEEEYEVITDFDTLEAEDEIEDIEEVEELEEPASQPEEEADLIEEVEGIEDVEEIEDFEELEDIDLEEVPPEALEEIPAEETSPSEDVESLDFTPVEPLPVFLEPEEHEPPAVPTSAAQASSTAPTPQSAKGERYDIELLQVGKQRQKIVEILSKISGLTKSPQELVETLPSIIARGAPEADAQKFQLVMQQFGAQVRLLRQS